MLSIDLYPLWGCPLVIICLATIIVMTGSISMIAIIISSSISISIMTIISIICIPISSRPSPCACCASAATVSAPARPRVSPRRWREATSKIDIKKYI